MTISSDALAFTSEILAFVGFLVTCIALIRYLNPGSEYIVLANLVGKVRQMWIEYEKQGITADVCTNLFLSTLERLEDDVRDLLFVMNKKSVACQIRAWRTSFRIKKLTKRAQLLHIGLPLVVQMNKELHQAQRNPSSITEHLITLKKIYRSRAEFMHLFEEGVNPEATFQIPPVPWTPSLESFPIRLMETTMMNSSFKPKTSPEALQLSPEESILPPLHSEHSEAGKLRKTKNRSIVKKLFSGVRIKQDSYDSEVSRYV